jgi:hemolysin III
MKFSKTMASSFHMAPKNTATGKAIRENKSPYSRGEEIANVVTHGIGAVLSFTALLVFALKSLAERQLFSLFVYVTYAGSLLMMYSTSTFYHLVSEPQLKKRLKTWDHISIFFLIAGTYTPFLLLTLDGTIGIVFFAVIWGLAILGTLMKTKYAGRFIKTSVGLYIAMGWLIVLVWDQLVLNLSPEALRWLVTGGIIYSGGTIFYLMKRVPYHHMIWHICVLIASAYHFAAVAVSSPF